MSNEEIKTFNEEFKKSNEEGAQKPLMMSKTIKVKDNRKSPDFLDDETRNNIRNSLKEGGVDVEGLSDNELLAKLQTDYTTVKKIKDELLISSEEKNSLATQLNSYLNTHDSLLTDKAFVSRLFTMGIPPCFLKLFRDADTTFNDQKIWEVVRYSGIKVYDYELSDLLSRRRKIPKSAKDLIRGRLGKGD